MQLMFSKMPNNDGLMPLIKIVCLTIMFTKQPFSTVVNMQNTQEKIDLQKMKVKFNVMKTRRFVWTEVNHNRKEWRPMFDQQFRCMVDHLWCSDRQVGGWWAGGWAGSQTKLLLFT